MTTNDKPGFLHRPPRLHPITSLALGIVFAPVGLVIPGSVGGALVGMGVAAILMAAWDGFRVMTGMIRHSKREVEPPDDR